VYTFTHASWPSTGYDDLTLLLPASVLPLTVQFTEFYSVAFPGRKLRWVFARGDMEIRVSGGRLPSGASFTVCVSTLQGVVLSSLNKKAEAAEAFRRVLRVEPAHALSTDEFTPSVISQFEGFRKELARQKKVVMQVQSAPPGAEVLVEGRVMGVTPLKLELSAGAHTLVAKGEGLDKKQQFKLKRGEKKTISLALTKVTTPPNTPDAPPSKADPGTLEIHANPFCSAIKVDGAQRGLGSLITVTVPPGAHSLECVLEDASLPEPKIKKLKVIQIDFIIIKILM
jgi:hypothetical protein